MMQGSLSVEHKPFIGNGILSAGPMKKFNVRADWNVITVLNQHYEFSMHMFVYISIVYWSACLLRTPS